LRLLPHQIAFESNRSHHLPQLTLNRGYISRLMIAANNAVFRSELSGPQHLSLDVLIPTNYLNTSFIEQCSNQCFNVILKGIGTAISKLFTRFIHNNPTSTPTQKLIVSRVTILMLNALCRAMDPLFNNDEKQCFSVFVRIATSSHFNTLCNKILALSQNIIPSEIKCDENDILPTIIGENTGMLDLGYLEKYVQTLQSYLWTNKNITNHHKRNIHKKNSNKKKKKNISSTQLLYDWPSGPQKCTEAESVQYIFKQYRGKKNH